MNQQRTKSEQKRTFQEIPNPYTPGSPLKPGNPTFLGREDIFNFIQQNASTLGSEMILVLSGERRTGKTSILKQLPVRLNDPHTIPIYVDGLQVGIDPGERNFFLSLTTAIADGLEESGIFVPRLTPEDLGESPQSAFEQHFLPVVRERIGNRTLLLTIDEFEELGTRVSRGRLPPEIFPYLRHLIQHEEQLAFIFAGTHKMEELIGDYWSVLFNIAVYREVSSFLSREEAIRLIREPVRPYGMVYDDLAVNEILHLTACHPYFTQLLCNILVNRCNEAHCNYVTIQDVRGTVEELLETGRAHLSFLWQTSDREEKTVISVLAELKKQSDRVTVAAIANHLSKRQLHLDPELVVQSAERLANRDIVQSFSGDRPSLDFTAQLYAHWLRKYKPFSLALKEAVAEEEWQQAKHLIEDFLFATGSVTLDQLTSIAEPGRQFAWSRYLETYRSEFDFVEGPLIRFANQKGLKLVNDAWQRMLSSVLSQGESEDPFGQCAKEIVEQVRLVGFHELVSEPLPRHPRLLTFLLDTELAFEDTKLPPAVPLVFIRQSEIEEGDISEIRHLLHTQISPSCNLAFVVVPGLASRQRIEDLLREKLAPYAFDVVLLGLEELQRIIVARTPQTLLRRLVLSKVNLISISPFVTTGATSDNIFFGREPELREIHQHIGTTSYVIIGGRRIGKSSLLGRLHRVRLPSAGLRTIYHDCSPTPTYEAFLTAAIRDWRPESPHNAPATFGDLLQSPPGDKSLVLLLDEADKVVPVDRANNWRLFTALRAVVGSDRVQVVLSGERTLRDALSDPKSPLFNFANEMVLGPLDYRAVEELVTRPMRQLEIELVDERAIVDRIWAFTSGHPNVVQRLCHRLIERLNEQDTRRITLDDVNAIIGDPGFQRDDFLSTYWEAATPLEKIISLLMADDENIRTLRTVRQTLVDRCNLQPKARDVDDALQRLVDLRSILKRTPTGYEFAVQAFPRVVAGTMTLDDMLEILTEEYQEQGE
jgi:hypothetical protein